MSWENSVLPVFMATSGQIPGRLPELAITVQIDTTLYSSETSVSHGFQRFNPSFNRTAVIAELKRNYLFDIQNLYPNASWVEGPDIKDNVETNELTIRAVLRIPKPLKRSGKNWRNEYGMSAVTDRLPKIGNSTRNIPVALDLGVQRAIHTYTLDVLGAYHIEEDEHEETIESPAFTATIQRQRPSATRLIDTLDLTLLKDTVEKTEITAHHQATQDLLDFRPEVRLSKTTNATTQQSRTTK